MKYRMEDLTCFAGETALCSAPASSHWAYILVGMRLYRRELDIGWETHRKRDHCQLWAESNGLVHEHI